MENLEDLISNYLDYCRNQKGLNDKTLKAYKIDLFQFLNFIGKLDYELDRKSINEFVGWLNDGYKAKSKKRKIASVKAFCNYLVYEDIIDSNPFSRLNTKTNEPFILPRTIPFGMIEKILHCAYDMKKQRDITEYQYKVIIRDIAVLELLFATGIRVSELCSLKYENVDLLEGEIRIYGKGAKERIIQIGNEEVLDALKEYYKAFYDDIDKEGAFFINRLKHQLSEQSVRFMIKKYTDLLGIELHITPHMFRHSFATLLLEEDVDIRYIQKLLGHSSITTTQIYTHVSSRKQRDILCLKHPRNKMQVNKG